MQKKGPLYTIETIGLLLVFSLCLQVNWVKGQELRKTLKRLPDTGQQSSFTNSFGEDNDYQRYTPFLQVSSSGIVLDTVTGLMWQQQDGGEMTYENARQYCDTLSLGGFTDWRLPSAVEAFSILNLQFVNPAINTQVFTPSAAEYWWSNQTQANDSSKVWCTNAGGGIGNHPRKETISAGGSKRFHVRAVRNPGQAEIFAERFVDCGDGSVLDRLSNLVWMKAPASDTMDWEQALSYAEQLNQAGSGAWHLPDIRELQSLTDYSHVNPGLNTTLFQVQGNPKIWSSSSLPNQPSKAWYLNSQFGISTYDSKTIKHNVWVTRWEESTTGQKILESTFADLVIYPNPFCHELYIENGGKELSIDIYTPQGQLVKSGLKAGKNEISELAKGIYLLEVQIGTRKTIKVLLKTEN